MANESVIKLFEGKQVRIVWNEEEEKYYFSVADIVQVLTDTVNPRDYIKKMLRRDPELKSRWGTICPPIEIHRCSFAPNKISLETLDFAGLMDALSKVEWTWDLKLCESC